MSLFLPPAQPGADEEQFSFPYVDSGGAIVAWRVISADGTSKKSDVFVLTDGTVQATPPAGTTASAEVGGAARFETVYSWQQVPFSYTATLVASTRTVTLTLLSMVGSALQAGEIDWGDGSAVEFYQGGNPSHVYPPEARTYMISVLGFNPLFGIEQSVQITVGGPDQTVNASVTRLKELPVARITTGTGGQFYFSVVSGASIPAPLASIAHAQPLQPVREKHTQLIANTFSTADQATWTIHEGFSQAVIRNVSGSLEIQGQAIPAGATFELPPLGSDVRYGAVNLRYQAPGSAEIWEWRRSL